MADEEKKKKLTKKQKNLIELFVMFPFKTDREISEIIGMSQTHISQLKKCDYFMEEYNRRLNEVLENARAAAQQTMFDLNAKGDFRAAQYILDSLGLGAVKKIEADVNNNIINVTIDDD